MQAARLETKRAVVEEARAVQVANAAAVEVLAAPPSDDLLRGLPAALAAGGVTAASFARVASDAMTADKPLLKPDGKGGVEVEMVPDHATRLAGAKLVAETLIKARALQQGQDPDTLRPELPPNFGEMSVDELVIFARRTVQAR